MTLTYWFGKDNDVEFEYEVDEKYADYLADYLENEYSSVEEAVKDIYKDVDDEEEEQEALKCESLSDLASFIRERDESWAEDIVCRDGSYVDYLEETLKDKYEDEASEAFDDENDGCDPDGFYGWDDYWHWKNG